MSASVAPADLYDRNNNDSTKHDSNTAKYNGNEEIVSVSSSVKPSMPSQNGNTRPPTLPQPTAPANQRKPAVNGLATNHDSNTPVNTQQNGHSTNTSASVSRVQSLQVRVPPKPDNSAPLSANASEPSKSLTTSASASAAPKPLATSQPPPAPTPSPNLPTPANGTASANDDNNDERGRSALPRASGYSKWRQVGPGTNIHAQNFVPPADGAAKTDADRAKRSSSIGAAKAAANQRDESRSPERRSTATQLATPQTQTQAQTQARLAGEKTPQPKLQPKSNNDKPNELALKLAELKPVARDQPDNALTAEQVLLRQLTLANAGTTRNSTADFPPKALNPTTPAQPSQKPAESNTTNPNQPLRKSPTPAATKDAALPKQSELAKPVAPNPAKLAEQNKPPVSATQTAVKLPNANAPLQPTTSNAPQTTAQPTTKQTPPATGPPQTSAPSAPQTKLPTASANPQQTEKTKTPQPATPSITNTNSNTNAKITSPANAAPLTTAPATAPAPAPAPTSAAKLPQPQPAQSNTNPPSIAPPAVPNAQAKLRQQPAPPSPAANPNNSLSNPANPNNANNPLQAALKSTTTDGKPQTQTTAAVEKPTLTGNASQTNIQNAPVKTRKQSEPATALHNGRAPESTLSDSKQTNNVVPSPSMLRPVATDSGTKPDSGPSTLPKLNPEQNESPLGAASMFGVRLSPADKRVIRENPNLPKRAVSTRERLLAEITDPTTRNNVLKPLNDNANSESDNPDTPSSLPAPPPPPPPPPPASGNDTANGIAQAPVPPPPPPAAQTRQNANNKARPKTLPPPPKSAGELLLESISGTGGAANYFAARKAQQAQKAE